jgi:1-acyl-sn-glycerol-3-phosphate acyltransferase
MRSPSCEPGTRAASSTDEVGEPPLDGLPPFERRAFSLAYALNERAHGAQEWWLRKVSAQWMHLGSRHMLHPVGLERLAGLSFDDGILLVSNHRSFFDLYMLTLMLDRHTPLKQPVLCPVRSDFFYTGPLGAVVNLVVGADRMFPPFFRDPARADFNKWALEYTSRALRRGRVVVGYHPEGRRNKNADPYERLPAQPGVGKLIMETWPIVVPAFIHGLSNDFLADVAGNFRRKKCVVGVFGEPIDLSPFKKLGNRVTSHKRIADAVLDRIYALADEEKAYRASCPAHAAR